MSSPSQTTSAPQITPASTFWAGFFLACVGSILFSAKAVVTKLTYRYGVDALTVIGFRMAFSLPFFLAVAAVQAEKARRGRLPKLNLKDAVLVLVLGFIGYYLSSYLDFLGLQYISAGLERLILFLSPSFVMLISAVWSAAHFPGPVVRLSHFLFGRGAGLHP